MNWPGVSGILAAMPDSDSRWSRGERVGCGCFLIVIGSVVTFTVLVWSAMDGFYGETGRWSEAILFAGLAAGAFGLVLDLLAA